MRKTTVEMFVIYEFMLVFSVDC